MYYRHTNPSALRSQRLISDALICLMREKSFSRITVTEICEAATVGRKTFYRNFEQKEDVIDFQLDELYAAYQEELARTAPADYMHHHFSFLGQHIEYMILLYRNGLLDLLISKFSGLLPQVMPLWSEDPVEQKYRAAYISAGINAVIRVWAENGFGQSVEELVRIVRRAQDRQVPLI